jgi:hypothetical protein
MPHAWTKMLTPLMHKDSHPVREGALGAASRASLPRVWTKPPCITTNPSDKKSKTRFLAKPVHPFPSGVHHSVQAVHHSVRTRATFRPARASLPKSTGKAIWAFVFVNLKPF